MYNSCLAKIQKWFKVRNLISIKWIVSFGVFSWLDIITLGSNTDSVVIAFPSTLTTSNSVDWTLEAISELIDSIAVSMLSLVTITSLSFNSCNCSLTDSTTFLSSAACSLLTADKSIL